MRNLLPHLLLIIVVGNQAYCQNESTRAGCTYAWRVWVEDIYVGSDPDTVNCNFGDEVRAGFWHNDGGACPEFVHYDWYYDGLVCNELSTLTPDTTITNYEVQFTEQSWFKSTTYTGNISISYETRGCIDFTIIRTEPASIGLLDSEKWKVFYDQFSGQIITRTEESNSYELNLYSIDGRIVGRVNGVGNQQTDVSGLPTGIYIASIETEKGVLRKKLMIQPY